MNIIVKTFSGNIVSRPDTTWAKDNEDYYVPPFAGSLSFTPVLYAKISKPGKSIGARFAGRYYETAAYGMLLYPDNLIQGSEDGFAAASCIDHTSILPSILYQKVVIGGEGNEFVLSKAGNEIFRTSCGSDQMIEKTLVEVSEKMSIRTGDFVAIELQPRKMLVEKGEKASVSATYCDNFLFGFTIIPTD